MAVGHTIRSATAGTPMLHANFMTLCFMEPGLLPMEVLCCGNRDLRPFFAAVTLTWWPSYTNLTLFPGDTPYVQVWTSYVKAFGSYRVTDRQGKRQTCRQTDTTEIIYHPASPVVNETKNFCRLRKDLVYAHDWELHTMYKCSWQETKGPVITNCVLTAVFFCIFPNFLIFLSISRNEVWH